MALNASNSQALEEALTSTLYLTGQEPTALDNSVFTELLANVPDKVAHPHLWAWFCFLNQFTAGTRDKWPAAEAAEQGEEEDFDLFADDPAAEEAAKKQAEERQAAKPTGPVGRSNVVFDVKPQYSTVDLDTLAERIRAEIRMEGLKWGEQYKKVPVAFGIYKLAIGCVIEDSVETELISELICEMKGQIQVDVEDEEGEATGEKETIEDNLAQSVDIALFQKL